MKTMATAKVVGGAMILLGTMFLAGCGGGPTGADEATGKTDNGIRVIGAGSEMNAKIDQTWAEVEGCWGAQVSGEKQTVTIQQPELYDKTGLGVIRVNGTLVYGMRIGNQVWVAPDLAALRHEFSHVVGERVTGKIVENGAGKCWL